MSSPGATADMRLPPSGTRGGARAPLAVSPASNDVDSGEPIDDLPPLIEPEFIEPVAPQPVPGQRPPRRSFLAPVASRAAAPSAAPPASQPRFASLPSTAPPPIAETADAPSEAARPGWATRWSRATLSALSGGRRLKAVAVGIGVAVVVIGAIYLFNAGPFSQVRHYPASTAPTDPVARFSYFQRGAAAGDADAQLQLAILYAKGEGVAQDYATAATWFRAAANQGVARAQYDLGVLYERGRGVKADLTEAANWYLKAAQSGHPLAQYNLAVCYTKGQGIRQDLPEAALWYRRAAAQGVVQAMINLGTMYERGEGVAASPVDAYAWYLAAGRRDNQQAARRSEDLFNGLPKLDQIRAQALASDVAASIHDPEQARGEAKTGSSDAKSAASTR